ncbi:ISL3 family transposase [Deinococcus detaillensis]|uniref:ISL3 family transposase n=1 Tax=Deinococcus detaillensis TaxID=2592048 RepID=A0A553UZ14_9DEIO|nr:ISL3 family transposase [Deinococcus detaillensis]TSA85459.1 ISL3 family transposase [Deinococcus detaillensis]
MENEVLVALFLTHFPGFRLDHVQVEATVAVVATSIQPTSGYPKCGTCSYRIHSRYRRHLTDLPVCGAAVTLELAVRRFVCQKPLCHRQIFCERFVDGLTAYIRRSQRARATIQHVSVVLGGNAGAALLTRMQHDVSASTVLRAARLLSPIVPQVPEVIGVDDFAFRRGHVYGTVIFSLETCRPIDLLPDRRASTLATWLKQHPHIKIISRGRSLEYEKGIREGAPTAQHVLDRWHVLKNCREALERQLGRDRTAILEICQDQVPMPPPPRTQSEQLCRTEHQQQRQKVFGQIHALSKGGRSQRAISRTLHLSRGRVRGALAAKMPPPIDRRQRLPGILEPFLPYLQQRFGEGEQNAGQLLRELREQGFPGSRKRVAQWIQIRRTTAAKITPGPYIATAVKNGPIPPFAETMSGESDRAWTFQHLIWVMLRDQTKLDTQNQHVLAAIKARCEVVSMAHDLTQAFTLLMRERQLQAVEP